jgi:opacity protein-like surface antigen
MNKAIVLTGVIFFCLVICGISSADTIGNSSDILLPPGRGVYSAEMGDFISLNVGFDMDFLIEKKFKSASNICTDQELKGVYYMGKLSCTLFDRIQPYATLGFSDLEMEWKENATTMKVDANTAFAWGAGFKAYLWEFQGLGLKVFSAASFRTTKPSTMESVSFGSVSGGTLTEKKFYVMERQAALGINRAFNLPGYSSITFVPYGGVTYSETTARVRITRDGVTYNTGADGQKENVGVFFGTDFVIMDNVSLNLEGRVNDQKSVSAGFVALF